MGFILLLITSLCGVVAVQGMCYPSHPQKAVCSAQFVIRGRYMGEVIQIIPRESEEPGYDATNRRNPKSVAPRKEEPAPYMAAVFAPKVIRVRLDKIYKGIFLINGSVGDMIDITIATMDKISFKQERMYLFTGFVSGGKLYTGGCHWNPLWEDVTLAQRFGLKRYYWMYCKCEIRFCPDGNCARNPRGCNWNIPSMEIGSQRRDCHSKYNICVAKGNRCIWYSPKGIVNCDTPIMP